MPDLTIRKRLWNDFVVLAEKQHKKPEMLAHQVIQEYYRTGE